MGILKPPGPGILYLDQCAFCDVISPLGRPGWLEVSRLVEEGVLSGRLVVPLGVEHVLETADCEDRDKYRRRFNEMRRISGGLSFITSEQLTALELFARVREADVKREQVIVKADPSFFELDKGLLSKAKRGANAHFVSRHAGYNSMRNRNPSDRLMVARAVDEFAKRRSRKTFEMLAASLRSIIAGRSILDAKVEHSAEEGILEELLAVPHSIPDLVMLVRYLEQNDDKVIPSVNVGKQLMLDWNRLQRDFDGNDYFDFSRMKIAVPCADIIVTDAEMASAIRRTGVDLLYGTKVFSCKESQLDGLISVLKSFVN